MRRLARIRSIARTVATMSLALLAACTQMPPRATAAPTLALASPGAQPARSASQIIHAAFGPRAVTLRTAIEIQPDKLSIVGVTATGQRLFDATYDGKAIAARKSALVPDDVDPERVLADVQLALWPLAAVQTAFRARGLEVSEPFAGVRRLRRGDVLVAEVHYASADPWMGRLWLVNFEFDYSLTIDTSSTASN